MNYYLKEGIKINYSLISYTIFIGVCIALLKCVKPLFFTTSLIFSSPACAPKAGPLKANEFGTHINVDAA